MSHATRTAIRFSLARFALFWVILVGGTLVVASVASAMQLLP